MKKTKHTKAGMHILLVYPKAKQTFWTFKFALWFISKLAANPPLGLASVAAMIPISWRKKFVDMNISALTDADIRWADIVFISGMSVHRASAIEVIAKCKSFGTKVAAGGPLFSSFPDDFKGMVDYLILGEAELTFPPFLRDFDAGCAKSVYQPEPDSWADMTKSPTPLFELLDMSAYASMSIQVTRGCPFNCEFCNVITLFGRKPRTKSAEQIITELEALYDLGWRGGVFFVDDNFIGDKAKIRNEILPAISKWSKLKGFPFSYSTEVSINLSDDVELMNLMVAANFDTVFVGVESPNSDSLAECGKHQNHKRNLIESIKKMQRAGLEVQAGFILGFDSDPEGIFDWMIKFIQESGICTAMVGLLTALKGTRLYERLRAEGRLLGESSGNNTGSRSNFKTCMNADTLAEGKRRVTYQLYSPKEYLERLQNFLREFNPNQPKYLHFNFGRIMAGVKSMFWLGLVDEGRAYYWKLVFWTIRNKPYLLPRAITLWIYGYHFRRSYLEEEAEN